MVAKKILQQLLLALKKFPLAVVANAVATVMFVLAIDSDEKIYFKIAATAFYATLFFVFVKLLPQRWQRICELAGIVSLPFYYHLLSDIDESHTRLFQLMFFDLALFSTLFWVRPFFSNLSNTQTWNHVKSILQAIGNSFIFTLVLIAGLYLAAYAINVLFDICIDYNTLSKIDILLIGFFGVNYFLSQIPVTDSQSDSSLSKGALFGIKYILTTLTLLYFVILYLYTFKIILQWELPKGIVAWLVLCFSVIAIATYLAWIDLKELCCTKWHRLIWLAILLQSILLFVAIGIRIEEYGWTESRYYVVLFGLWLFGNAIYFLLRKEAKILWIFLSFTVAVLFSQFGPLSAYRISCDSQSRRLQHLLGQLKSYSDPKKAPLKLRYEISNRIDYLSNRCSLKSIKKVLPKVVKDYETQRGLKGFNGDFAHFATKKLGFAYVDRRVLENAMADNVHKVSFFIDKQLNRTRLMLAQDFKYVLYVNSVDIKEKKLLKDGIVLSFKDNVLSLSYNGETISLDLEKIVDRLEDERKRGILSEDSFLIKKSSSHISLVLKLISIAKLPPNDKIRFEGYIFFK